MVCRLLLLVCCFGSTFGVAGCTSDPARSASPAPDERILVDGEGADWASYAPLHTDPTGDVSGDRIDLGRLWMAHDDRFLFLRVEVGREINIQEGNELTLFLDADNDPATGEAVGGIGAELTWTFGAREGQIVREAGTSDVRPADIGLVTAPTVSSRVFEVALDRRARPNGAPLFAADTLRLVVADRRDRGDRLPDEAGGVAYALGAPSAMAPLDTTALARSDAAALRLVSYNVEFDGLFDAERAPVFARTLRAVRPDLLGLQEVYDHDAEATRAAVEAMLPSADDAAWYGAKAGLDLVVVSRYPILSSHTIPGHERHESGAFLIDAREALGTELLFVLMHPPCCSGGTPPADARRQQVVDRVLAFLREVRAGEGPLALAPETPVVVAGDMNFVGDDDVPRSLRTGAVADTARFGPAFAPDWDGGALLDLAPRLTGWPMNFTWYNPSSRFAPGRLDYVYLTDSVLRPVRQYVLFTPGLAEDQRRAWGLEADDAVRASDHLPLVVDLAPVER